MTHNELVDLAAKWLATRSAVVITEMTSSANETPDAIGFTTRGTILVECKTSLADYRADGKKPARRREWILDCLGDKRYYLVPHSIADAVRSDLEASGSKWGLLVAQDGPRRRVQRVLDAIGQERGMSRMTEIRLLVSAMRRLPAASLAHGVYVKPYVITNGGEPRATLGVRPQEAERP